MTATPIASPRARTLGASLRAARESREIGLRELSRIEGISHAMLSLWEKGTRLPKVKEVASLLGCLSITGEEREYILELAEHAHEPNWLKKVPQGKPLDTKSYLEYERSATTKFDWHPHLIPGILQSGDYARAVISADYPRREETDSRLLVRMTRRKLLDTQISSFTAVIGEQALRQRIVGPTEMIDQVSHLLTMSARPNIKIHVLPAGSGFHGGLSGSFVILDFESLRPIVFCEHVHASAFLYEEEQIRNYRKSARQITELALSEADTRNFLNDFINELEAGTAS